MDWYLSELKKYAVFSGRAGRKEFWMFVLANFIFSIVVMMIGNLLETIIHGVASLLTFLFVLAVIIPSLAISVRRLHDIGKNGGWVFISFIPLIGQIWLLVLMGTEGTPGENQYGPNPKETVTG